MDSKAKRQAIGLVTALGLAAAFLLYFLRFHNALPARDSLLSWMPESAETVLFVDLGDLRRAPFFAELLAWAPKPNVEAEYGQFRRDSGFDYEKDLDRIAVAFEKRETRQIFFAAANGRFDREKIKVYATQSGSAFKQGGREIFSVPVAGRPEHISFTFPGKDLIAFTNADDLTWLLKPVKTYEGADWHTRFERVAGSPIFAVIRNDGIKEALGTLASSEGLARRATGGLTSPQLSTLLAQLRWITLAGKPENDRLRVVAEGESSEDSNARQLADLLNGVVLLARAGLSNPRTQQQIGSAAHDSYLALLKSVDVSRIDRGDTKAVRLMFDVTPNLLKSAQLSVPASAVSK